MTNELLIKEITELEQENKMLVKKLDRKEKENAKCFKFYFLGLVALLACWIVSIFLTYEICNSKTESYKEIAMKYIQLYDYSKEYSKCQDQIILSYKEQYGD